MQYKKVNRIIYVIISCNKNGEEMLKIRNIVISSLYLRLFLSLWNVFQFGNILKYIDVFECVINQIPKLPNFYHSDIFFAIKCGLININGLQSEKNLEYYYYYSSALLYIDSKFALPITKYFVWHFVFTVFLFIEDTNII